MNRRSFLSRISAIAAAAAAAPSVPKAATPVPQLQDAANEIHRQQSGSPAFICLSPGSVVAEIVGDHPLAQRGEARIQNGELVVEFDVLANFNYTTPSWLRLSSPSRYLIVGDVLSVRIPVDASGRVVAPLLR